MSLLAGLVAVVLVSGTSAGTPVLRFQDPVIAESSGLVAQGDLVLTVNDSGGLPVVYAVDGGGRTVGRTTYAAEAEDVEAMAPGRGRAVWVGDIGDNASRRPLITVYRLPAVTAGDRVVTAVPYRLRYQGGARDAEALLLHPRTGRVFVVSKGLLSGEVYAAPPRLDPGRVNLLRPVAAAPGLVTDGAFLPDGRHVLLRTYSRLVAYDARTWRPVGEQELPDQPQGEGLAAPDAERVLISTEGVGSRVLAVRLAPGVRTAVAPPPDPGGTRDRPSAQQSGPRAEQPPSDGPPRRVWLAAAGAGVAAAAALGIRAARRRGRSRR